MNTNSEEILDVEAMEGTWELLSDAVKLTGLNEKTLRRHAATHKIRSRKLGAQHNAKIELFLTKEYVDMVKRVDTGGIEEILFDGGNANDSDVSDRSGSESESQQETAQNGASASEAEFGKIFNQRITEVIKGFTTEFASKLDEKTELIQQLKKELDEKDIQLRLLPDLQKSTAERVRLELQAQELKDELQKKLEENQALSEQLKATETERLEKERLQSEVEILKATLESTKRPWWKKMMSS